jgi:hypothetical protein
MDLMWIVYSVWVVVSARTVTSNDMEPGFVDLGVFIVLEVVRQGLVL